MKLKDMFDEVKISIDKFIEESEKIQNNPESKCNMAHCVAFLLEAMEAKFGPEITVETRRMINERIRLGGW